MSVRRTIVPNARRFASFSKAVLPFFRTVSVLVEVFGTNFSQVSAYTKLRSFFLPQIMAFRVPGMLLAISSLFVAAVRLRLIAFL